MEMAVDDDLHVLRRAAQRGEAMAEIVLRRLADDGVMIGRGRGATLPFPLTGQHAGVEENMLTVLHFDEADGDRDMHDLSRASPVSEDRLIVLKRANVEERHARDEGFRCCSDILVGHVNVTFL